MTSARRFGDAGQAFPIYITVVGGLLFLAFVYLAVGQAAANRNGAQTAADAAALAAALDTRDKLTDEWVDNLLDPTKWQDIFDGVDVGLDGCGRAHQLAAQNDATADCTPLPGLPPGYTVDVETTESVGDSIVPGTENMHSKATATAVIELRCDFDLPGEDAGEDVLPELTCGDDTWDLNPDDLDDLPGPEDLFDVHLADAQANDE
ncbi:pilus assembly protein TadG-related protein [Streptomyces sp. DG2A-72]|uniref:pilus assembly protein TadG-related protein n=1 Tax=Streptomyces sp. DG2A-72 TaxID=3051386 RepID=UPI00265BAC40|nr:pilus assembly protein TadG-related protein [Streptomyces sp. DG2A-72]MDO0935986.1 pilus assembly protein TadG-related protein [Streptomyces sp. DG2A-72]